MEFHHRPTNDKYEEIPKTKNRGPNNFTFYVHHFDTI